MWRYRNTVLLLCMLAFFATMASRLAISPVVPLIIEDFSVSNAQIGLALTGMWVAYALSQFPSGIITDRVGEKRVILVAVGGSGLASLVLAFSPMFALFALVAFLIGLMAGLHYTPATVLLTKLFDNVGTAIGVHTLGGPLAGLLTPIAVVWVGLQFGWRPAVGLIVLVATPVFILFLLRVRPEPPAKPDDPLGANIDLTVIRELITHPTIAFTIVIMIVGTFVWQGLASFLPTFIIQYHGLSATTAGIAFSAYFVILGTSNVVVGILADRYGRDPTINLCMVAGIIGFIGLVTGTGLVTIAAGVVLVGIGASSYPAMLARLMDTLPTSDPGTGLGLVRTIVGVIGALGPVMVGLLADLFSWRISFLVLGSMFAIVFMMITVNKVLRT